MLKIKLTILVVLSSIVGFAQATLFSNGFETNPGSWNETGDLTPNAWIKNSCAGNGPSASGVTAGYITSGGTVAGCGPTGTEQYAYTNAPAGMTHQAILYHNIDATCATSLQVTFDYRIDGVAAEDYMELVYSTDGGTSWTPVGGALAMSTNWTTTTINLPALLDASTFELGFRFTYNDATVTGNPAAFDNVVVTGTDNIPPSITCIPSADLLVDASCQATMVDYTKHYSALSDNCTDSALIVVTQSIPEFTPIGTSPGGSLTVTLTATDESGNQSTCDITVNVVDATNPVVTCPGDTSEYVDMSCQTLLHDYTGFVTGTDNCSTFGNMTVSQSPAPGTLISGAIVNTNVTMTLTDESGNSSNCVFVMRTLDTLVTQITCPADTVLPVGPDCKYTLADYTAGAVLVENCEPLGNLTITQSPPAGTEIDTNTVLTLTVTGGTPNIPQTCTFNALLIDTITPSIGCPPGANIYVDNTCLVALPDYTGGAIVVENCSNGVTVTQTPLPGTMVGPTAAETITLTVADSAGNQSSCQFIVPVVDTISPTVTCPANQSENGDATCVAILSDYTSLAVPADNCTSGGSFTVTQSPIAGTSITSTQTITITVLDEASNSSTCTFDVTIADVINPTITCPANQTVTTNSGCNYSLADFTGMASGVDNCTAPGNITYSQSPAVGTLLAPGTHTITITGQDEAGNPGSCTFDITVADQTPPTFTNCASTQLEIADASCQATLSDYTALVAATDDCTPVGSITFSQSPSAGTVISTATLVTVTATDASGNSADCQFTVGINDTIDPVIACPNDQLMSINGNCEYTVPDLTGSVGGTDNCSVLANMSITQNPPAGNTESSVTPVLITLTDEGGNSTTCTVMLTPNDVTPPTVTCPSPAPENLGTLCDFTLPNYGTQALVLDNCSNYTITQTPAPGTIVNPGTNQITLDVTDAGGNTVSCSFDLQVIETVSPTIDCPSDTTTCDPVVIYSLPTFSDNCFAFLQQTDITGYSSGSTFPIGLTVLEYAAIDSSGNMATCSFRVEVLDYPSPAIIADDTISICDATSTVLTADPITSGNGLWTLLSGQGDLNNQFASNTGVNNLGYGTNVFEWSVSSASCGTLSDTVVVIASQAPSPTSIAADTIFACTDPTVDLTATAPIFGTGVWTTDNGASIDNTASNVTTATVGVSGWHEFTWTVSNPGCPSTSDSVQVFYTAPISASASDSSVCLENGTSTLSAGALISGQSSSWYFAAGGGIIEEPGALSTEVTNLQNGVNTIIYEVTHPNCPTQYDTVIIISNLCDNFDPVFPTMITPNLDGKNDLFEIQYLELLYPNCRVTIFNRWGSVVFESVGYTQPWNGTYNGEPLPMGTYFYKIELNDSEGTVYTGDISIIH